MEVDQIKTGGDMKVECKFRSGGDMPTPRLTVSFVVLLLAIYYQEEVSGRLNFNIIPLFQKEYGGFLTSK